MVEVFADRTIHQVLETGHDYVTEGPIPKIDEINSEEEIYKLVEQMESYYVNLPTSIDPYDESDIEKAHEYVTNWVKTH